MISILSKLNCKIKRLLQNTGLFVLASSVILGVVVSEPLWADTCDMNYNPVPHCVEQPSIECHTPADCIKVVTKYTLMLEMKGEGKGQVTGGGTYEQGISITLTAQPNADSLFSGWQPKDQCFDGMTLSANTTCTATFDLKPTTQEEGPSSSPTVTPQEMSLWVQVDGSGSGKVSGAGLSCHRDDCQSDTKGALHCASNCTQLIPTGNTVTLTPEADSNSIFSSWGGSEDCHDGQVTMDSSKACTAFFRRLYRLTVQIEGPGRVTGTALDYHSKKSITCGQGQTQCDNSYELGTREFLQVQAVGNAQFQTWKGDCSGSQSSLEFKLSKDMDCQAIFLDPTTVVNKVNQTITDFSPVTPMEVGKQITLTATGGASGNPVTFASTTPEFCTMLDNQTVTFAKAGTCKVTADQAGNDQYHAAPTVTANIEAKSVEVPLVKQNQEISHFSPTDYSFTVDKAMVNSKTTLIATGGASGNPVTYSSTTPAICTVSENTVSLLAMGTCTITADQAGNDLYYPAPQVITQIQVNQPVEQPNQATSNWSLVTTSVVGNSLTLTGMGGTSGNPVTFTSTTPTICTMLDNKTIRFDAVGICTVTADQTGNAMSTVVAQITVKSPSLLSMIPLPPTMFEFPLPPSNACPGIKEDNGVLIASSSCNAQGEIFVKPIHILPGVSISDLTINNTVDNKGFLSNIEIGKEGSVMGGTLSGFVRSQGKVCDVEFIGNLFVGGTLCGDIKNNSKVGACLENVTASEGTTIEGCVKKQPQNILGENNTSIIAGPIEVKEVEDDTSMITDPIEVDDTPMITDPIEVKVDSETGIIKMPPAEIIIPESSTVNAENIEVEAPDLTKGLIIEGLIIEGIEQPSVIDQLAKQFPDFNIEQNNGVVNATGTGKNEGVEIALIPIKVKKVDQDIPPHIVIDGNLYTVTTEEGLEVTFLSAFKNPVMLLEVPGVKKIQVMKPDNQVYSKVNGSSNLLFDPFVTKAPEGATPGMSLVDTSTGTVVYPNGTMQSFFPAMSEDFDPALQAFLIEMKLKGSIILKTHADGSGATFMGPDGVIQDIKPAFTVSQEVSTTVSPKIELVDDIEFPDGMKYIIVDNAQSYF